MIIILLRVLLFCGWVLILTGFMLSGILLLIASGVLFAALTG